MNTSQEIYEFFGNSRWILTVILLALPITATADSGDTSRTAPERVAGACAGTGHSDGDTIVDNIDNCCLISNQSQIDTDWDGYGDACDKDFNNDGVVNFIDLGRFRTAFFGTNPLYDCNGDGAVNVIDLGIFRTFFFLPPGPSCNDLMSPPAGCP